MSDIRGLMGLSPIGTLIKNPLAYSPLGIIKQSLDNEKPKKPPKPKQPKAPDVLDHPTALVDDYAHKTY